MSGLEWIKLWLKFGYDYIVYLNANSNGNKYNGKIKIMSQTMSIKIKKK